MPFQSSLKEQKSCALGCISIQEIRDKTRLKKLQLDEMAKYLKGNPDKKVFVVGHTDNPG